MKRNRRWFLVAVLMLVLCNLSSCQDEGESKPEVGDLEVALKSQATSGLTYGLAGTLLLDDPERLGVTLDELDSAESVTLTVRAGNHQLELCADDSANLACSGLPGWVLYELTCDGGLAPGTPECFADPGATVTSTPISGAVLSSANPQPTDIRARQTTRVTLEFEAPGRGSVTFGRGSLEIATAVQEGLSDGRECVASVECRSHVCADQDGDGTLTCQPASCGDEVLNGDELDVDCGGACDPCAGLLCADSGAACASDADCCSLSCEAGGCGTGPACGRLGDSCISDADCCSLVCGAGTCADAPTSCDPVGEACTDDGSCCSGHCAGSIGQPCTDGVDCRCAFGSACRAQEEVCSEDLQCCTGLCDRPNGTGVGRCASIVGCAEAGEPCGAEGLTGACCSLACADTSGTGTPTCQALSGCLPQQELCTSDAQCCSGSCAEAGTTIDGRPIRRCVNVAGCLAAGEVCGGGASANCCPAGGGDTGCKLAEVGVSRCHGGDPICTLPADACVTNDECCTDTSFAMTCAPNATGLNVCCLPQGETCAFGAMCCAGACTPDAAGTLRCN